jgi:cysteine-rich repeat protein
VECLEGCDQGGETASCDADCTDVECGDGELNATAGEGCDDGAANSDSEPDACRANCQPARCGDGIQDTGEECDDHNTADGDGCTASCALEAGWTCAGVPSECSAAECGDGIRAGAEACDDGTETASCDADCTVVECGDGMVNAAAGEDCEDGAQVDGDGCSATCVVEAGWTCYSTGCRPGVFVVIPAGSFTMGSPVGEPGRESGETQHQVTLSQGFEIQTTEVTQAQFASVMGYNPSANQGCPTCSVETVNWHEAAAYCNAMSMLAGLGACYDCAGSGTSVTCALAAAYATPYACPGYRLPTEAEWEYAARAGTTTGTYNGTSTLTDCENPNPILDPIAWFCGNSLNTTHAAGGKAANAWGIYDMLGNVWEWVHDCYLTYPGDVSDPWGPAAGSSRVFRGGGWGYAAWVARAARRSYVFPSGRDEYLGFRPVRSSP